MIHVYYIVITLLAVEYCTSYEFPYFARLPCGARTEQPCDFHVDFPFGREPACRIVVNGAGVRRNAYFAGVKVHGRKILRWIYVYTQDVLYIV